MVLPEAIILLCKGLTAFHIGSFILSRIDEQRGAQESALTTGDTPTDNSNTPTRRDPHGRAATPPTNSSDESPENHRDSTPLAFPATPKARRGRSASWSCGMTYPLSNMRNADSSSSPNEFLLSTSASPTTRSGSTGSPDTPIVEPDTPESTDGLRYDSGQASSDSIALDGLTDNEDDDVAQAIPMPARVTDHGGAVQQSAGPPASKAAFSVYTDPDLTAAPPVALKPSSIIKDITNLPTLNSKRLSRDTTTGPRTLAPRSGSITAAGTHARINYPSRQTHLQPNVNLKRGRYHYPAPTHCPFFSTPDVENITETRDMWRRRVDIARMLEANRSRGAAVHLTRRARAAAAAREEELSRKSGFIRRMGFIENVRWDMPSEFEQYLFLLKLQAQEGAEDEVSYEGHSAFGGDGESSDEGDSSSSDDDTQLRGQRSGESRRSGEGQFNEVGYPPSRDIVDFGTRGAAFDEITVRLEELHKRGRALLAGPAFSNVAAHGYEVDIGEMRDGI